VLGIVGHPGAFAEYLTLPERNLHPVPPSVPDDDAVFLEPLAAACEILDQIRISNDEPVAVLGDGKLGLLIAQVLHAHGARVTLYGRHVSKLAIAGACGIDTRLADAPGKRAYQVVVDATGSAQGLRTAVEMVRPRGTIVLKSTIHGETAIDFAPIIVNEVTLVGSRCGRFEPALELLSQGKVAVRQMVSAAYPLSEAAAAFSAAAAKGALKVLLRP
jgi:alcohol dehydrogenase